MLTTELLERHEGGLEKLGDGSCVLYTVVTRVMMMMMMMITMMMMMMMMLMLTFPLPLPRRPDKIDSG